MIPAVEQNAGHSEQCDEWYHVIIRPHNGLWGRFEAPGQYSLVQYSFSKNERAAR